MKIYKIADSWDKFAPTITLYHGTTDNILNSILQNGFKPFNAGNKIDEILARYGFSRKDVPDYIFFSEFRMREKQPYIYFTTYKEQAALYAQKPFGEFETSIVDLLNRWLKEKGKKQVEIIPYKPVVITVDAPWELFKSHKQGIEEYKDIYERYKMHNEKYKKTGDDNFEEYASDIAFEFWIDQPLSKEYIVDWEYVTSSVTKMRF